MPGLKTLWLKALWLKAGAIDMGAKPLAVHSGALKGLNLAARLVADIYDSLNRPDLSSMIRAGNADDFPEIKTATALLEQDAARLDRYESALLQYADQGFWDDISPGGVLALHDGGEMARNVLAGRPAFDHRD